MAIKKQVFLLLLPLLLLLAGSLVNAAPKGKGRQPQSVEVGGEAESAIGQMPASVYGGAGFGGRGESVKDAEGNTEMVQEADNEVDEEEGVAAPEDHQQVPMMNAGSGRMPLEEEPHQQEGEEFEERGSLHPQEHETAIGDGQRQLGDVRHYKPALESGHIGEEDEAAHRFGEREEGEKSEDEAGAEEREEKEEEKEHKGEEEEEDGNVAENGGAGLPRGEEGEEEKKRAAVDEGHHQNDGEDDKFMHIYPFLHGATPEAIAAFHALIRDQHLTKAEVEQKRGEWAKEQGEAIQKGFHDWKDHLAAKKQRVIGKIEEKLDSFADETKRLYIELKAIIADQTISRHQECEQIRSLVTSADEALRDDFLDKVKRMHLVKFCMEEEQQGGGGGPMVAQPATKEVEEEGGERQQGPAQLSDGTDDLEQNHPPAQRVPMPAGAEADEHQQPSPIDEGGSQEQQQPGLKEEEEEAGNEIGGGKSEEEKTADEGTQDGTGDEEEADKLMAQGNGGDGHPHPHHQEEYEHPEEAEENEAGEGEGHEGVMQNDGAVPTGNKKLH